MRSSILHDIRERQKSIIIMAERSAYLRAALYGRAIRYDVDRVQTSPIDAMSTNLADICDQDAHIRKRQRKLDREKADAREYLSHLPNEDYARALDLFYLSLSPSGRLYSWNDVADLLGKDRAYTQKVIHFRALEQFNNILRQEH